MRHGCQKWKKCWHFKDEKVAFMQKPGDDKVNTKDNYERVYSMLEAEGPQNVLN